MKEEIQNILGEGERFCQIIEDCFVLFPSGDGPDGVTYDIAFSQLKEPIDLVDWIIQLSEKTWMNNERMENFCLLVCQHYGWLPHRIASQN